VHDLDLLIWVAIVNWKVLAMMKVIAAKQPQDPLGDAENMYDAETSPPFWPYGISSICGNCFNWETTSLMRVEFETLSSFGSQRRQENCG
jgi:hypothetical protein